MHCVHFKRKLNQCYYLSLCNNKLWATAHLPPWICWATQVNFKKLVKNHTVNSNLLILQVFLVLWSCITLNFVVYPTTCNFACCWSFILLLLNDSCYFKLFEKIWIINSGKLYLHAVTCHSYSSIQYLIFSARIVVWWLAGILIRML